jgi:hypothetical protein
VEPWQVVEVQVDTARVKRRLRHRAKLRRLRPDLQPGDVPFLDE